MRTRAAFIAAVASVLLFATAGEAEDFVEWVQEPYAITLSGHFTQVNQVRTGATDLVLHHNVTVTVSVSEPGAGDSVLRCTEPGSTDTLATSYKLSGIRLAPSDGDWIAAADFVGRNYTLSAAAGEPYNSTVQLDARAANAINRANDKGQYTATITVTAVQI